jgi:hypothetical protein
VRPPPPPPGGSRSGRGARWGRPGPPGPPSWTRGPRSPPFCTATSPRNPQPQPRPQTDPEWHLYYWPGVKGRGEYVRLCFEEAGVPYVDVAYAASGAPAASPPPPGGPWAGIQGSPGFKAVIDFCFTRGADGGHAPMRAPPAIARRRRGGAAGGSASGGSRGEAGGAESGRGGGSQAPGVPPQDYEFVLDNTPVVCSYLNSVFGWDAALARDQAARVDQILSVILSDAVAEGRLAFHPRNFYASHKTQAR